jgi:tRNA G18 (ribose-2'-O)-methylase SpoU
MSIDVSAFASLRDRDIRAEGLVLAEGRLLAERLLMAAREPEASRAGLPRPRFSPLGLVCVPALAPRFEELAAGLCPLAVLSEAECSKVSGYPFHRGVMAAARREAPPSLEEARLSSVSRLVILPETIDPENMGSVLRSAAALGYDGVLAGAGCCDPYSRKALRVSMGAAFTLPLLSIAGPSSLGILAEAGFGLAAAVLGKGARPLSGWQAPARLGLLFGNEYAGLGEEWLPPSVERLTIPMAAGSDSLNAAAAAAVFLYELSLEKEEAGV